MREEWLRSKINNPLFHDLVCNWDLLCPEPIDQLIQPSKMVASGMQYTLFLSVNGGMFFEANQLLNPLLKNINNFFGKEILRNIVCISNIE